MNDSTTAPPRPDAPSAPPLRSLRRSRDDRWIAGVSGGVARHVNVDPVLLRIAFVVLVLVGGAGIIAYGALWLFVPEEGADRSIAGRALGVADDERLRTGALVIAAVLALAAVLGDSSPGTAWGLIWFFVWVGVPIGILYWFFAVRPKNRNTTPIHPTTSATSSTESTIVLHDPLVAPDAPPSAPRTPREPKSYALVFVTLSLVAIAIGAIGVWDLTGGSTPIGLVPAAALAIIGSGVLVGAWRGNAGWLVPFGLFAAAALAVTSILPQGSWGNQNVRVGDVAELQPRYEFGVGEFVLDLTALTPEDLAGERVEIDSGWGAVRVLVDDDVPVDLRADIRGGSISARDWHGGGSPFSDRWTTPGSDPADRFVLDIDHTFGEITVHP